MFFFFDKEDTKEKKMHRGRENFKEPTAHKVHGWITTLPGRGPLEMRGAFVADVAPDRTTKHRQKPVLALSHRLVSSRLIYHETCMSSRLRYTDKFKPGEMGNVDTHAWMLPIIYSFGLTLRSISIWIYLNQFVSSVNKPVHL
jgi:hypothetical protein